MHLIRSLLLCSLALLSPGWAFAVDPSEAVLEAARRSPVPFRQVTATRSWQTPQGSLHLLQLDGRGFVLLMADGPTTRVLGYGERGGEDLDEENPIFDNWVNGLQEVLHRDPQGVLVDDGLRPGSIRRQAAAAVGPLTTTAWGQAGHYNDSTPPDGNTVATGCVATAIAQAMRYYEHPVRPPAMTIRHHHSVILPDGALLSYGPLEVDLGQVSYPWQQMPDRVLSPNAPVADLMYHLGISLRMRYRPMPLSSNAYFDDIPRTLRDHFGYDASTLLFRSAYSDAQWRDLLRSQLEDGRVLLMCGYDYRAGAGHCWVVDGVNEFGHYHMNWGWNGSFNGHYSIDALSVIGYDFGGYSHVFTLYPTCAQDIEHAVVGQGLWVSNRAYAQWNRILYRPHGQQAWSEVQSSLADLHVSGLLPDTDYEFQLESQCSRLGRRTSPGFAFRTAAATSYCASRGQSVAYEWIEATQWGSQRFDSGPDDGHADHTSHAIDASRDQDLIVQITPGHAYSVEPLYWSLWIDLDQDGHWSAAEKVWQGRATGPQSLQLDWPSMVAAGSYRVRLTMSYYPHDGPCGDLPYGEVEDYLVTIQ